MNSNDHMLLLKTAAEEGNLQEVKRFIETENVPVDQSDDVGDTALHAATAKGRLDVVKYLLGKGADPNVRNKTGSTPLHKVVLCRHDQMEILKALLKNKADPTIRNGAGLLPEQLSNSSYIKELLVGDQSVTDEVEVPKAKHGRVIGKEGKKLKEIREATGANITIPEPSDASNKITIKGRREGVDLAKEMILQAVAVKAANSDHPEEDGSKGFVRLPIPRDKHGLIIGKAGKTIKALREELGVEIIIPPQNSHDSNIVVKGESTDDVDAAVKQIYSIIQSNNNSGGGRGRGRGDNFHNYGEGGGRGGFGRGGEGRGSREGIVGNNRLSYFSDNYDDNNNSPSNNNNYNSRPPKKKGGGRGSGDNSAASSSKVTE